VKFYGLLLKWKPRFVCSTLHDVYTKTLHLQSSRCDHARIYFLKPLSLPLRVAAGLPHFSAFASDYTRTFAYRWFYDKSTLKLREFRIRSSIIQSNSLLTSLIAPNLVPFCSFIFRQAQPSEEPPFLTVGTDVSAKYRGAFCEANVKVVKKLVKCKVSED